MFLRYLQYLLTDFRQTFVPGASWDTDDLITFLGRKVKGQGHTITAEAHSTRRYRRASNATFSSCFFCFCKYSIVKGSQYLLLECQLHWSLLNCPLFRSYSRFDCILKAEPLEIGMAGILHDVLPVAQPTALKQD